MFDFGLSFSHIVIIVLLAVIVIGPRDLPVVLRRFGQFLNKMRRMARDFQSHVDVAMKDAGIDGLQKDLQSLRTGVTTAMSPVQSALQVAVNSVNTEPDSKPATMTRVDGEGSDMRLPDLESSADFTRIFGAGTEGETRVQGRGLSDANS